MLTPPTPTIDNDLIVRLIQVGDPRGEQLLYENYRRGLRFLAARHSPDHAEDCLHDTVLIAIRQIRQGQLDSPAALPGYLNIILKRAAWNKNMAAKRRVGDEETFQAVVQTRADDRADPQRQLEIQEQAQLLQEGLQRLKPVQREILTRFYLKGEQPAEICKAMNLTDTQYRLLKSRSKQILQEVVAKRMTCKPLVAQAAAGR